MDLKLRGKVVLITGSGKGIGKEIAKKFADEGANIILNDINREALSVAYEELSQYPVDALAVLGNVADECDARRMFGEIKDRFKVMDILINNAAVLMDKSIVDMTINEWNHIFSNNLNSIFIATKEAIKIMRPENNPVIVNAGSFGQLIPANGYGAYNASKAAIGSLTRTLAGELNPRGIRVTGYIPGVILTDIIQPMLDTEPERLLSQISLGRLGDASEIANGVVFISSEAAGYINGTMMEITGGKLCVQNPGR